MAYQRHMDMSSKVKMGLFRTFFKIETHTIFQVYPQDIHGISKVFNYKKRYGTNPFVVN